MMMERNQVAVRPKILNWVCAADDPAADAALAEALPHVERALQSPMVDALLERGNESGLTALPVCFDKVDDECRNRIIENIPQLFGALRLTIRFPEVQVRLNSLEIIRRSANPRLAYLTAMALRDPTMPVREAAGRTINHLAECSIRHRLEATASLREKLLVSVPPDEPGDGSPVPERAKLAVLVTKAIRALDEERQNICGAICDSLNSFNGHHRPEVLHVAMSAAEHLESEIFQQRGRHGNFAHAMVEILLDRPRPEYVPFVYIALCHPEFRRRVTPVIANCRDTAFVAALIRYRWLAQDPDIGQNLHAIRELAWLSGGLDAVFELAESAPDVIMHAPEWLLYLGLSSHRIVSTLNHFFLVDGAEVQRAALWALTRVATPAAGMAIEALQDHSDEVIRSVARQELVRRRHLADTASISPAASRAELAQLEGKRPREWIAILAEAGLMENFACFWNDCERISAARAKSAGEFALQFVPDFVNSVNERLASTQPIERLRSLRLIVHLHLHERFRTEIFRTASDSVSEVRAAVAEALGVIGEATSKRILERLLSDLEPEVQAAAIHAIDRAGARNRVELVEPRMDSEDANVRSAALLVLLRSRVPRAARALLDMLQDPRSDHRCAAIWLAEHLRLAPLAPRLLEMAEKETDPRIARIARHVAENLQRSPDARGQNVTPVFAQGGQGG